MCQEDHTPCIVVFGIQSLHQTLAYGILVYFRQLLVEGNESHEENWVRLCTLFASMANTSFLLISATQKKDILSHKIAVSGSYSPRT